VCDPYLSALEAFARRRAIQIHVYFSLLYFMMGLSKPKLRTKFEVARFSRCKNIKEEATNFEELPEPQTTSPTFLLVGFDDAPWQTAARAKFEVAGFICYGNIRESVFKLRIHFLSHAFGELGVTYGLHL